MLDTPTEGVEHPPPPGGSPPQPEPYQSLSLLLASATLLQALSEAVDLSSHVPVTLLLQSHYVGHLLLHVVSFLPLTLHCLTCSSTTQQQQLVPKCRSAASSKGGNSGT